MDIKEEMNSQENDSGKEFFQESEPTLDVDEIEIKHEEMDFHLHHNSTAEVHSEDKSDFDLGTMYSITHTVCESTEAKEKDLKDFYHDILLCDRDCETCIKYMGMLSDHVRTTHASHQPIQDPLLIDPVPLTGQSSSPILIKSEVVGNIVKMELDCSEFEDTSVDEFIRESETTLIVDEIEIKPEEMDFHLHHNSTAEVHSGGNSHSSIEQLSSSAHFEYGFTKAEEMDLNNFYNNVLLCERDCETCLNYMRMLSEHVIATHAKPQPSQDPLLIDPVPLAEQSSLSIEIKSEVDEIILKNNCSDSEDVSVSNSDADPDYNIQSDSESDPNDAPSPTLSQNLLHQRQCLTKNPVGSQPISSKSKKENLPSREHFKCKECGKSFKRTARLKEHMSVHTGENPFKCDVCERSFARSYHLTEHRRIHTGERPFKCDLCEKSFAKKSNLAEHNRVHTGEKSFKCDVCEKSFTLKSSLTVHNRIHTGEKPFQCDQCEKSFTQKSSLVAHKRNHTGERPYMCDQCGKRFTRQGNLTYHKKIHT